MPHAPELKEYIEAFTASSRRARYTLLIAIIASVLDFAAFWNSRQGSWVNQRLHLTKIAFVACPFSWSDSVRKSLSPEDRDLFAQSYSFDTVRHFHSCPQLGGVLKELETIQTEDVNLIRVPFFGIVFDVNDLGILGGLTFVIILLWFRFGLARELDNFKLAIDTARETGQLLPCYRLLEMHQVLSIPPTHRGNDHRFWRYLPLVLFFLPLVMSSVVLVHDAITVKYGWSISHFNTKVLFSVSLLCLAAVVILTFECLRLSREMHRLWKAAASELRLI